MRQMKDSTTAADILIGDPMVAGYVFGTFEWSLADWSRFASVTKVGITPSASKYGPGVHVLDVEKGDAVASQVPGWCNLSRQAGQEPSVYTNYSNWTAVITAVNAAGIEHPQYWIAQWDGIQDLPGIGFAGQTYHAVAKQYADSSMTGAHYDASIVADYWKGVDSIMAVLQPDDYTNIAAAVMNYVLPNSDNQTVAQALGVMIQNFDVSAAAFYRQTLPDALQQIIKQTASPAQALTGSFTISGTGSVNGNA